MGWKLQKLKRCESRQGGKACWNGPTASLLLLVCFISTSTQHSSRVFLCANTSSFATRTASTASTGADTVPIKTSPGTSCLLCDALEFSRPFETNLSSQVSVLDTPALHQGISRHQLTSRTSQRHNALICSQACEFAAGWSRVQHVSW